LSGFWKGTTVKGTQFVSDINWLRRLVAFVKEKLMTSVWMWPRRCYSGICSQPKQIGPTCFQQL